jgi:kynureninase
MTSLLSSRAEAERLDHTDPAPAREQFEHPPAPAGTGFDACAYFAGNSLGLLPRAGRAAVDDVLHNWSSRAVSGHFTGAQPWSEQAARIAGTMAALVGAHADEVVVMNTLTVNLHVLLAALYRPVGDRRVIAIEAGAFPSDDYAVASQLHWHGLDRAGLVRLQPTDESGLFTTASLVEQIRRLGPTLAAAVLGTVNFRTGQALDVEPITAAVHEVGALAVWDLAHAAGNVPVRLHDWAVDAGVWCTYKYLNGGPGSVGAAFIHRRLADRTDLPRLAGWWGNAPSTRFAMRPEIDVDAGALGWQISTPPALAMVPVRASVELFAEVGFERLVARSRRLTAFLESLFDDVCVTHEMSQLTPRAPEQRGAQLSMVVDDAPAVTDALVALGVVPDERPPNIVRFAPVPLYTSYLDCWRAAHALTQVLPVRSERAAVRGS